MIEKLIILGLFTFFHFHPSLFSIIDRLNQTGLSLYNIILVSVIFLVLKDSLTLFYPAPKTYRDYQ